MSKESSRSLSGNNAIPRNRTVHTDLPPAVRDLADLLAEIAFRRLSRAKTVQEMNREKSYE